MINKVREISNAVAKPIEPIEMNAKPRQSADAIFNFMTELWHLEKVLKSKMLSPRYCKENIEYLGIDGLSEIAFLMKCFCDINLHKLHEHIEWYGGYAIGLSKRFGCEHGIQPITYLNAGSQLTNDFGIAFREALRSEEDCSDYVNNMKNYLIHQLMYVKPVEGKTYNHSKGEYLHKCLTDEQEWRFVPSFSMLESIHMKQAIIDKKEFDKSVLVLESNSLDGRKECSLEFEYEDIKYILISNESELEKMYETIGHLEISEHDKMCLCTKIIVWNSWEGDL